jgi:hypothetical protein
MPVPVTIGPGVNVRQVILIVLLGLPVSAWAGDIREYYGVWTGVIVQGPDVGTPGSGGEHKRYEIKIVFGPAGYRVEYPSLGCGGKLHLVGTKGRHFHFRDELEYGKDRCSDNGYTELQMISHTRAAIQWFDAGRVFRAEGMLKRNDNTLVLFLRRDMQIDQS